MSLFRHADSYFNSHFHNLRPYCNAIWELKSVNEDGENGETNHLNFI